MKSYKRLVVLASLLCVLSFAAVAQTRKVDIDALITETQKSTTVKDEMTIVWWIPLEFWEATLAGENMPKAQIDEVLGILRPYVIVAVVDGKINQAGKVAYRSEAAITRDIRIVSSGNPDQAALPSDKIGLGMTTLLNTMKPIVSNILGSLGENLHFVVFSSSDPNGVPLVDARKPGTFAVRLEAGRTFTWRLPLASLSPPKTCPIDGEKLPANWRFCPFHGAELKN